MLQDGEKGVILQRDKTTYAIAPHLPCGVVSPDQLRKMADVAEKYQAAAMKITSAARIAMVGIKEEDIDSVWEELQQDKGAAVGLCVRSVKACPGTTFCKRGMLDSLSMGMYLDGVYHGYELPGKLKIGISGCPNQCAETCIKDIGLVGKKSGWDLLVGGNGGASARLSEKIASGLTDDQAKALIKSIVGYFKENAKKHERIGKMIQRIGLDTLKDAVLINIEEEKPKTPQEGGSSMDKYVCDACGYVYDPAAGDPDNGIDAGTAFDALPDDWVCPECGVGKEDFSKE